jgi:hypothetical protein
VRQRVEGLVVGSVVGASLGFWMFLTLHAILLAAVLAGGIVGLAIFAVVATKRDPADEAADAAWRAAAPDLPPASDRIALERAQEHIDSPDARRRGPRRAAGDSGSKPSGTANAVTAPRRAYKIEQDAGAPESDPAISSVHAGRGTELS